MNFCLKGAFLWKTFGSIAGLQPAQEVLQHQHLGKSKTWVCLKIGYIPNYSHLIGIMIINHWVEGYTIFRHPHISAILLLWWFWCASLGWSRANINTFQLSSQHWHSRENSWTFPAHGDHGADLCGTLWTFSKLSHLMGQSAPKSENVWKTTKDPDHDSRLKARLCFRLGSVITGRSSLWKCHRGIQGNQAKPFPQFGSKFYERLLDLSPHCFAANALHKRLLLLHQLEEKGLHVSLACILFVGLDR